MTLKAVLFDMDDTLLDWRNVTVEWEDAYRLHLGYVFDYVATLHPLSNREAFFEAARNATTQQWQEAQGTLLAPQLGKVLIEASVQCGVPRELLEVNALLEAYNWQPFDGIKAFDDVLEVLPDFQKNGLQLGVITNAFQAMAMRDRELAAVGLLDYFNGCRFSAADVGYLKPHPSIFETALQCLGVSADEVVFVGDSLQADVVGAQSVGMKAVLRANEMHSPGMLNTGIQPDAIIQNFHDLYAIFDRWYEGWR